MRSLTIERGKQYVYFPGLNGIRAIAASIVIFMHFNQFASFFKLSRFYPESDLAGIAVTVFFVLSGFLITYLLLEEKLKFGHVALSKFYVRRMLRIWPLYFLIIFITFFLYRVIPLHISQINFRKIFLLFTFFLPNYAFALQLTLTPITPLWSIGVEEQFYLIWPWLFRGSKSVDKTLFFLLGFLFSFLLLKIGLRLYGSEFWYSFINITRLDCMALGGLGAYFLKLKHPLFLKIIYYPVSQCLVLGAFIWTILYKPIHLTSIFDHDLYGVLALILILNVGTNPASIVKLENRVLNFLGKISYGLYCYHMLIIYVLSILLSGITFPDTKSVAIGMFLLIFLITIVIAHFSYVYVEQRFVNLKHRFSRVVSQNSKPIVVPK